ncbi:MAG: MATE family efflux transporter, partial [Porphyromonas endodontalis]
GRSLQPALISIIGNSIRIPLALIFGAMGFGLVGIWWAIATSMATKGIVAVSFLPYLKRRVYRHLG